MSTYGGGYGLSSTYKRGPAAAPAGFTRASGMSSVPRYVIPGSPYSGVTLPYTQTWTGTDGSVWPGEFTHSTFAGSTIQSNTGQITAGPGGGYDGALSRLSWMPNVVDVEVLVDVTAVSTGVEQYPQVALRTGPDSSATRPASGYSLFLCYAATPSSSFLQIERQNGGSTVLGTPAFTLTGGVTYRVRFQVIGADLKVKVWDASGSEPGSWTWTLTDSSPYLTAGAITLGQGNGADGVARSARFDNLTVATAAASVSGGGTLTAQAATLAASGTVVLTGTGALTASTATASGSGAVRVTGTGATTAAAAAVSGSGTLRATGAGQLAAQPATVGGSGVLALTGAGGLTTATATVAGVGALRVSGAGSPGGQPAAIAGSGTLAATGSGALAATAATLAGAGTVVNGVSGTGSLTAAPATASGSGNLTVTGTGDLASTAATVSGTAVLTAVGAGELTAQATSLAATALLTAIGTGELVGSQPTLTGTGTVIDPAAARDITVTIGQGSRSQSTAGTSPRAGITITSASRASVQLGTRTERTTTGAAPRARISIGPRE